MENFHTENVTSSVLVFNLIIVVAIQIAIQVTGKPYKKLSMKCIGYHVFGLYQGQVNSIMCGSLEAAGK